MDAAYMMRVLPGSWMASGPAWCMSYMLSAAWTTYLKMMSVLTMSMSRWRESPSGMYWNNASGVTYVALVTRVAPVCRSKRGPGLPSTTTGLVKRATMKMTSLAPYTPGCFNGNRDWTCGGSESMSTLQHELTLPSEVGGGNVMSAGMSECVLPYRRTSPLIA